MQLSIALLTQDHFSRTEFGIQLRVNADRNPDSSVHLCYVVLSPDSNPLPVVVLVVYKGHLWDHA